jgi:hypothetical protein
VIAALWYLIWRTTRNRLTRQLRRLRNPRYAAAMVVGALFVTAMFWSRGVASGMPEGGGDPLAPLRTIYGAVISFLLLLGAVHLWFNRDALLALAFQPAEVQLLFPAPLSRRVLLAYRVVRLQLLVVPNAAFWVLALRYWGSTQPAALRFAAAWAFFSFLSLHRLGAALVLVPPLRGVRWGVVLVMRGLVLAGLVAVAAGVIPSILSVAGGDPAAVGRALQEAVRMPPASIALAPFQLLMAPFSGWFVPILVAIAAQLLWINLASTVEFEEAAAGASRDLAQRIIAFHRGGRATKEGASRTITRGRWIRLAPTGAPAVAIVWKNAMSMIRGGAFRGGLIFLALIAGLTVLTYAVPGRIGDETLVLLRLMPGSWALFMSLLFGSRALRHDLRQDLLSLSLLKTYPLRGSQIVLAELALPTFVLTAFQAALVVIMLVSLPPSARAELAGVPLGGVAVLSILALGAINATSTAIQNGAALMFPAWMQLGVQNPGVEALGQSMLSALGNFLVLLLSFVLPAVVGALVWLFALPLSGALAVGAALLAGIIVLAGEVALMVLPLGRLFERTEPSAIV